VLKNETDNMSDIAAAIEAGRHLERGSQTALKAAPEGIPYAILADGLKATSLEDLLLQPLLIRQTVRLDSTDSFCRYVSAFKSEGTQLFANQKHSHVLAIIDYHDVGEPSRCAHRAQLTLAASPEWTAWHGGEGKAFSQQAFAEFLEDHELDIVEPDGATVLEAATMLEAKSTVAFKSGVRLRDGSVQFEYVEEIQEKARAGNILFPSALTLVIPIYEHSDPVKVKVRLRFRIKEGDLSFHYKLERPEQLVREAFERECSHIAGELGIVPLQGTTS